jgi:hypothetical protein
MTNKEKKYLLVGAFSVLAIVAFEFLAAREPASRSYPTAPIPAPSSETSGGYGLGETPGFLKPTPSQARELRASAGANGISEQEMEKARVQAIHVGMFPEDMPGGQNDRERQREQSRQASGWYDSQPHR